VILCAIAEAETIGRCDLASDIVRVFVAPVVYRHELANARRPQYAQYERGSCAAPRSPRDAGQARATPQTPQQQQAALAPRRDLPSDEQIRAMLNADPQSFIEMATRGSIVIDVPSEVTQVPLQAQPPTIVPLPQPTGLPPEAVAQMQEAAGLHQAANQTRAMAPGSPIAGVPDGAWREFVAHLERESPLFSSSRHVGQYRQRKERLAELGIEPQALVGSASAQRAALDADLADAHRHACESGLTEHHTRRTIAIPGHEEPHVITLSGMLGVIQAAGLDGAVGWLENPGDRKKFPHTTMAFLNTNGAF
jgi:hypothetical protein